MTLRAVRNRIDRVSDKVGQNRGELLHIILIETFTAPAKPDRVIEMKLFSKSGEMYAKRNDIVDNADRNERKSIDEEMDGYTYPERKGLSQYYQGD